MRFEELPPRVAKSVIHRMGETGQPPERGALAVNVGTDGLLEILEQEYLEPMKSEGRNSSFKLVQAPFGGGKTQFLHSLREIAWKLGFATSLVGVSPKECPFDDARKIFLEVVRNVELPPGDFDEERRPGLDELLRRTAEARVERYGGPAFLAWLKDEFSRERVESRAFQRACWLFMDAVVQGDLDQEELFRSYLFGEKLTASDLGPFQVREQLETENAYRFLKSLVQVLRALQLPGVVLLFDELDRIMSLSVKKRRAIGDNLRQMMDDCGQAVLPALLWVYAVPPEFMRVIVPEYPALQQRLKGAGGMSAQSPLAPLIDLDRLPLAPEELMERIGERLLALHELGWEHRFDAEIQRGNLSALAAYFGQLAFESGTRREFVKAAVQLLVEQHRGKEKLLSPSEVESLAKGISGDVPPPMDGEVEFS